MRAVRFSLQILSVRFWHPENNAPDKGEETGRPGDATFSTHHTHSNASSARRKATRPKTACEIMKSGREMKQNDDNNNRRKKKINNRRYYKRIINFPLIEVRWRLHSDSFLLLSRLHKLTHTHKHRR